MDPYFPVENIDPQLLSNLDWWDDLVLPANNAAISPDLDLNRQQIPADTRASATSAGLGINTDVPPATAMSYPPYHRGIPSPNSFEEFNNTPYHPQPPYYGLLPHNTGPPAFQPHQPMAGPSRHNRQQRHFYGDQGLEPAQPPMFTTPNWNSTQGQSAGPYNQQGRRGPVPEISPRTGLTGDAQMPQPRKRKSNFEDTTPEPESSRTKRECVGCEKTFLQSKDPLFLRCSRCHAKHVKNNAEPTIYKFDETITADDAWNTLYPRMQPAGIARDDVAQESQHSAQYLRRLVEAVSQPYVDTHSAAKDNTQRLAQQAKMNKKPYDSVQYTSDLVNKRLYLLYGTAVSYHAGGPVYYDIGGDNSGYGEDKTLIFSERLNKIIALLTTNKDIAMDVIEGRGVTALVCNPNKYERRKRDNKKSNDTKQDLQEKGKQLIEHEASMSRVGDMSMPPPEAFAQGSVEGVDGGEKDFGEALRGQDLFAEPDERLGGEYDGYDPAW